MVSSSWVWLVTVMVSPSRSSPRIWLHPPRVSAASSEAAAPSAAARARRAGVRPGVWWLGVIGVIVACRVGGRVWCEPGFALALASGAMGLRESATTTGPHHSMEYYRHAPRVSRTGDPALMRNGAAPGRSRMKGQYRSVSYTHLRAHET